MRQLILASLLLAIILFGCINIGGQPPQNQTNVTPPPPPAPQPSFVITEPADGGTVYSMDDTADLNVVLTTYNLQVRPAGAPKKDGEGHFRISADGGAYSSFYSKSYTLQGLGLGIHTVRVELVNNDNTQYSPAVARTATFEVVRSTPPVYRPQGYSVDVLDFAFSPENITVKVGDTITWNNKGAYPRSATSTGSFDTKIIAPGGSATLAMNKEGTFSYFALTYTAMKGTVVVQSNGTAG